MQLDDLVKVAGLAATVGATVGSLTNWLWKFYQQSDRITVGFGSVRYQEIPGFSLHVISRRDHKMEIADYGFIRRSGTLASIPYMDAQNYGDESSSLCFGSLLLPNRNARYEETVELGWEDIVGAYAETSTQKRPTISFRSDVGFWRRLIIKMRLYFKQEVA